MIRRNRVVAIVPAAGKGRRMRSRRRKQFLGWGGKSIIVRTLEQLQRSQAIDEIVVAADSSSLGAMRRTVARFRLTKVRQVIRGGKERQDSVWNCLQFLKSCQPPGLVLIHDGVRPFVTQTNIRAVLSAALKHHAAVLAVPPKETIKMSVDGTFVCTTPSRAELWVAQTPQAFEFRLLYRALEAGRAKRFAGTDDASFVEHIGVYPRIVKGNYENIKITTPEDMQIAATISEAMERRSRR